MRIGSRYPVLWSLLLLLCLVVPIAGPTCGLKGLRAQRRQLRKPLASARRRSAAPPHRSRRAVGPGAPGRSVYGVPADFDPPAALMLSCSDLLTEHPNVFCALVAATYQKARLIGLVFDDVERQMGIELLQRHGLPRDAVRFVVLPAEGPWVRDFGPMFVRRPGGVFVVDTDCSSRTDGSAMPPESNALPKVIAQMMGLPVVHLPIAIDGGNLLSNGDGLCVTSTSLLADGPPPHADKETIRKVLGQVLGFRRWVYLRPPIGERTQHVDFFVAFLERNVVVVGKYDPGVDPVNARILDEAAMTLSQEVTSAGPMQVYRIPMPPPDDGVWRTYTNIILLSDLLLVPTYSDADVGIQERALALYKRLAPNRKIVGINADSLTPMGGALRCISLNIPTFVPLRRIFSRTGPPANGAESLPPPEWR